MDIKNCEFCGEAVHRNKKRCPFCCSILKGVSQENGTDDAPESLGEFIHDKDMQSIPHMQSTSIEPQIIKPLSNPVKVFLPVITAIPAVGQLIGVMASIIFISDEQDEDRKSFGRALLAAALILFAFWGICFILFILALIGFIMSGPEV